MRLLILDQYSDPGGAQKQLLDLLPTLRRRGWQAIVGMPGNGKLFEAVPQAGFEAARVTCGPYASVRKSWADIGRFLTGVPRLAREIRQLAQRLDAELIYVNGPRVLPAVAMAGWPAPVLFHAHSYLPAGISRTMTGLSLRKLGAWVVGNSHYVLEPWHGQVRGDRLSVIYNGVDGPPAPMSPRSGGPLRIGIIGRIAPEKGQKVFLEVASLLQVAIPEAEFVIYGSVLFAEAGALQYEREVHAAAAGLPVEFAGWVTDVYAALNTLDLLLVPSTGVDATTRVIPEAFAARVPVIAFPSRGIQEIMENGRTGFVCDTAEEMARLSIHLLKSDPQRASAITDAAFAAWQSRFTNEQSHVELLRLMEQCRT